MLVVHKVLNQDFIVNCKIFPLSITKSYCQNFIFNKILFYMYVKITFPYPLKFKNSSKIRLLIYNGRFHFRPFLAVLCILWSYSPYHPSLVVVPSEFLLLEKSLIMSSYWVHFILISTWWGCKYDLLYQDVNWSQRNMFVSLNMTVWAKYWPNYGLLEYWSVKTKGDPLVTFWSLSLDSFSFLLSFFDFVL